MNSLNLTQTEQLQKIGAYLRQIRQEQSIPIEQVATKTFISSRLLTALEEGRSEQLPEPIFVQGFIRRYGDYLNLDGMALAQTFPTSVSTTFTLKPDILSQEIEPKSDKEAQPKTSSSSLKVPKLSFAIVKPYLAYVLLLAIASIGLLYLVSGGAKHSPVAQQEKEAAKTTASSSPAPTVPKASSPTPATNSAPTVPKASSPTPATTPVATPATPAPKPAEPSIPIQVSVNLKGSSWLRVVVDGKTEFEGILNEGDKQTWKAQKQLTVKSGNAGAVVASFNQQEAKPLGELGAVEQVTFTPQ
ncbi:MAG: RodZ domain-containing protein [Coleofasciculaceae cyanobacterium]